MTIDRSKLRSDVKRLSKGALASRPSSLTSEIRQLLPEIERLRSEDRAPWKVIAQALAEQGVTEGSDKRPLSERRLTSIITKLRAKTGARAAEVKDRARRSDVFEVAAVESLPPIGKPTARLAPELAARPAVVIDDKPLSEDEIRRLQREKHAHLIRKD